MTHMKAIQCIAKFQFRGFHNLTAFVMRKDHLLYIYIYTGISVLHNE